MSKINLFLPLFAFALLFTCPVFAKCPSQKPFAQIKYSVSPTEYIKTSNADHLTRMHTGGVGIDKVLGLAGGEVGTSFKAAFEVKQRKSGLYCLNVKKIKATFFARPKVYIASNFKRGTCEYANVLRHEEKHVKTLVRTHKEYMPKFKLHLRSTARDLPVLPEMALSEANEKKQIFVDQISRDLASYMQEIMEEVAIRQKEVDSQEEYERVLRRCKKWEKRLSENP